MKPLIGITGRSLRLRMVRNTTKRFGDRLTNLFFTDFDRSVAQAGGVPVNLPFVSSTAGVIDRLDGLIISGGQDVHPSRWGGNQAIECDADPRLSFDAIDVERDQYEAVLIGDALASGIPVLGVCRGHQLLNVVLGGTLVEDIPEVSIVHAATNVPPYDGDAGHVVEFAPDSIGREIYGAYTTTNSWHHQSVSTPGRGLVVTGRASDGIAEMIELPSRRAVGVQWHPEWHAKPDPIFDWFIAQCSPQSVRQPGSEIAG